MDTGIASLIRQRRGIKMSEHKWWHCDNSGCKSESRNIDSDNWLVVTGDIWWQRQKVMDDRGYHFCSWQCVETFCNMRLKDVGLDE